MECRYKLEVFNNQMAAAKNVWRNAQNTTKTAILMRLSPTPLQKAHADS
jgi:hypothetical protein